MNVGITMGDMAGIGPEISLKAISHFSEIDFSLIGPAEAIRESARRFHIALDGITLIDVGSLPLDFIHCGRDTAETGRASHDAVVEACQRALDGALDAIVTAPISKKAWSLAGFDEPGHTELIGAITKSQPVMAFSGRESDGAIIRLALATIHLPLADVSRSITHDGLLAIISIAEKDLRQKFRITSPRIALAGLNPHAGESGRIGDEEQTVIAPVIEDARSRGIDITGPIPGDVVFTPRFRKKFDLIIAMYHDQGLAPFKALTSGTGVNVTLGIPIIRTSPDHGTAYDIAGNGIADSSSMIEAIRLAHELILTRKEPE